MNKYNKALFKLGIAIWLSKSMQGSQFYKQIEEILEVCWKWLENHEVSADDLYFLLDDGTDGFCR
ncbi:MAG: Imm6 family immunity protein [Prevotella melaninogenica]